MKLKWPWKKETLPDVSLIIEYYHDSHSLIVKCYPTDMEDVQVVGILDMAADLIDTEGTIELNGHEDLERFLSDINYEKGDTGNSDTKNSDTGNKNVGKRLKHMTRVK